MASLGDLRVLRGYPVALFLLAMVGCATPLGLSRSAAVSPKGDAAKLRPGAYCHIEMVVPPTASRSSYLCYVGTVREVTREEIILDGAIEEGRLEYETSPHQHGEYRKERGTLRVPLTGIAGIELLDPPPAAASDPPKSSASQETAKQGKLSQ